MRECVRRLFVEKKPSFDVEAQKLYRDFTNYLGIQGLEQVRVLNRYDIEAVSEEVYLQAKTTIFAEPPVDLVFDEQITLAADEQVFAVEYLPGQYDQRADSAAQCIQILTQKEKPLVQTARVIVLKGKITSAELEQIKAYCINPVDSRAAGLQKPMTLQLEVNVPNEVPMIAGFTNMNTAELKEFMQREGLAMSFADLQFCQAYFRDTEQRDPTITEIKVIDTYWSDHCRHTTFLTKIEGVDIEAGQYSQPIQAAYSEYLQARTNVYGHATNRPECLMDMAVIGMKELKQKGLLQDLDESDEINACSIVVPVDIDGKTEDWLIMFKNETHNHPTEIEPFGGAATCLGGAIRDPLSGRSYVYQAMRVTGSGDPRTPIAETLVGKLPQRKITTEAAAGYSSYGNQIGLATGQVTEVYHQGFVAKRMEVGAVIAAAPKENVVRLQPVPGDVVILVGGRTGRDGCGGATGSSKEHTEESILTCGAEVQKGNPPVERKIQRLFRRPEVSRLIKRCNDFGAGGVSVAIGELTEGISINLDLVPKKYEGLDGTELAISESQERMAVVVAEGDAEFFIKSAAEENLEATVVANVTDTRRVEMQWRQQKIVDLSRDFLDTNGVQQVTQVKVAAPQEIDFWSNNSDVPELKQAWLDTLAGLNVCSQKGLLERFDSTIGAASVLMPLGGKYQLTPAEGMVAKVPVLQGDTTTGTIMTFGYNPDLASWSPFHGAVYAVLEAVAKVVAIGGDYSRIRLSLQEYFAKLGQDPERWGQPFSALLGALKVQRELGIPAIGGKDSMSGTYKDLDVPPTVVAFAVAPVDVNTVVSPEFKAVGSKLLLLPVQRNQEGLPDFNALKRAYSCVNKLIKQGKILAAKTVGYGGLAEAISKMCFGNGIGASIDKVIPQTKLFSPEYGALLLEVPEGFLVAEEFGQLHYEVLGVTQDQSAIKVNGITIDLAQAQQVWQQPLEAIFPTKSEYQPVAIETTETARPVAKTRSSIHKIAKPRIFLPVFPGTNCEYDTVKAFERAGGQVETLVFGNLTPKMVEASLEAMVKAISSAQIVMLAGGFSAGDEPDGSGKFIATVFRNPSVKEAVTKLLHERDGLMLGICNGFQALIKLGLVPYGEIREIGSECPTLTYNNIGRHVSCMVNTEIVSVKSPWLQRTEIGDVHTIPVSHGEGRFVASPELLQQMLAQGQVATRYVNDTNPNGSVYDIEGITSPDGRIFGKMGHSERIGTNVAKNVPGAKDQQLFRAGVEYFS